MGPPGPVRWYSQQSRENTTPVVVDVEDVGADVLDRQRRPHEDPDVDAPVVVAVDEHHLLVRRAADVARSSCSLNRCSVVRSSASTTPRTSAATSRTTIAVCRSASSSAGSRVRSTQPTQSARPSATTSTVPSRWRDDQLPADHAQDGELGGVGVQQAELVEEVEDALLAGGRVDGLLEQGVELAWASRIGRPAVHEPRSSARARWNRFSTLNDAIRTAIPWPRCGALA